MLASFPCAAIFWTSYEVSKVWMKNNGIIEEFVPMGAAALAECAQAVVRTPFEVVKTNLQIG
jgi:hypothetical protein